MNVLGLLWLPLLLIKAEEMQWIQHNGFEYYIENTQITTYTEANDACSSYQATLALVKSEDIQNFLVANLGNPSTGSSSNVLIGLRRKSSNYQWDDGSSLEWLNWKDGKPSSGGENECVTMGRDGDPYYKWVDVSCTATSSYYYFRYVCQREKVTTTSTLTTTTTKLTTKVSHSVTTSLVANKADEEEKSGIKRIVILIIIIIVVIICIVTIVLLVVLVVRYVLVKRKNKKRSSAKNSTNFRYGVSNLDFNNTVSTLGSETPRPEGSPALTAQSIRITHGTDGDRFKRTEGNENLNLTQSADQIPDATLKPRNISSNVEEEEAYVEANQVIVSSKGVGVVVKDETYGIPVETIYFSSRTNGKSGSCEENDKKTSVTPTTKEYENSNFIRSTEHRYDTTLPGMNDKDENFQPISFQDYGYESIGGENSTAANSVLRNNEVTAAAHYESFEEHR